MSKCVLLYQILITRSWFITKQRRRKLINWLINSQVLFVFFLGGGVDFFFVCHFNGRNYFLSWLHYSFKLARVVKLGLPSFRQTSSVLVCPVINSLTVPIWVRLLWHKQGRYPEVEAHVFKCWHFNLIHFTELPSCCCCCCCEFWQPHFTPDTFPTCISYKPSVFSFPSFLFLFFFKNKIYFSMSYIAVCVCFFYAALW